MGVRDIQQALKVELDNISGKIDDHHMYYAVKPAVEIQKESPEWVSEWVARRVATGSLWHETWRQLIKSIPSSLQNELIARAETEDLTKVRPGGIIPVLSATADVISRRASGKDSAKFEASLLEAPARNTNWNMRSSGNLAIFFVRLRRTSLSAGYLSGFRRLLICCVLTSSLESSAAWGAKISIYEM